MIEAAFAIPGDLSQPTGGYAYDRRVMGLLPVNGVNVQLVQLSHRFPQPSEIDLAAARRSFNNLPVGTVLLVDGLAYGAMPSEILASVRQSIVALVHHPLAFESGLSPSRERELFALEHEALGFARHTITTSETTKRLLVSDYGVPEDRITVAEPGTDPRPRALGSGAPLRLLAVGAVSVRKGYDVLVEALSALVDLEWEATIAGSLDRDPQAVAKLKTAMMAKGLRARIDLAGAVSDSELDRLYARADLFVMPSLFEGYGMVLTEAVARGLPIVCTTGGAAAETVPDAAALKVPPGDAAALADALRSLIGDKARRTRLADASWRASQSLMRWEETARIVAGVLKAVAR